MTKACRRMGNQLRFEFLKENIHLLYVSRALIPNPSRRSLVDIEWLETSSGGDIIDKGGGTTHEPRTASGCSSGGSCCAAAPSGRPAPRSRRSWASSRGRRSAASATLMGPSGPPRRSSSTLRPFLGLHLGLDLLRLPRAHYFFPACHPCYRSPHLHRLRPAAI